MSKTIQVDLKLIFNESGNHTIDLSDTKKVPLSMILETLENFNKFLAQRLVEEARHEVPDIGVERYLDAQLKIDRKSLIELIQKQK